jgi:hypothetical protein
MPGLPVDSQNDIIQKIAQVCVSCPHMKFKGGMVCDRKKSQCHSGKVRKWLAELEKNK